MSIILPRDYQANAISAGVKHLFESKQKNGLILMPTGTGKSIVIGGTVKAVQEAYPPARMLMLTHNKELIEQNYKKAVAMAGDHIGMWSAGLNRADHTNDIVFAGIDTVANNPQLLGRRDVIMIDEAHRVAPQLHTNYRQVIEEYLYKINPHAMTIGYTATDYRLGQGPLTAVWHNRKTGEDVAPFWQTIILDLTSTEEFNKFFEQGYLKRLVPKPTVNEIDVTGFREREGEYVKSDVEQAVNNEDKVRAIVDEICENGFDRRSWLVFAAGNRNAEMVAKEIASRGVTTAVLTEKTPAAERARILAAYKRYEIRCLVNNDILTTGFDHEGVDLIAVVRVTASASLWVQMLGRGTRPVYAAGFDLSTQNGRLSAIFASGVYNCLVLDFAGNSKRLGAINAPVKTEAPDSKRRKKQAGSSPIKVCPACGVYNYAMAKFCENVQYCTYEFPLSGMLELVASKRELIEEHAHEPDKRKLRVTSTRYVTHDIPIARGQSVSNVTVTYNCGSSGKFSERLMFNGSDSTKRIKEWWASFGAGYTIPRSNKEFMDVFAHSTHLRKPSVIEVYMNPPRKSRPEVTYYGFEDKSFYTVTESTDDASASC